MKPYSLLRHAVGIIVGLSSVMSCSDRRPSFTIAQLNLKRGAIISCGPPDEKLGSVNFPISDKKYQADFNLAVSLLHSFEYDESEKVFSRIIDADPDCAMAYWGVAMCNFHPLWTPPTDPELVKGSGAVQIAKGIPGKTKEESALIDAIAAFYTDWKKVDHLTRCARYEAAMSRVYAGFPDDKEAAVFYALSLDAAANPNDQTFARQKKAGNILQALYAKNPNHPGIIHYIIHTYDYPGLAQTALPAAREYAKVAPSSAHALHMPSHIFTRLGYWDECIASNVMSLASAKCYAEQAQMKGHWAEELHAMDYLTYAYLQKGENEFADEQLRNLLAIKVVYPADFKVAYAFASIPARVCLENKHWNKAANAGLYPTSFAWSKYPWQESIYYFSRLLGAVHLGQNRSAQADLDSLVQRWTALLRQGDRYKAKQVEIQVQTGKAWIDFESGNRKKALAEMAIAATMEDSTQTPGYAGRGNTRQELYGDMLSEAGHYDSALTVYEAVLQRSPNRFNSLYGAGYSAQKPGMREPRVITTSNSSQSSIRPNAKDRNWPPQDYF